MTANHFDKFLEYAIKEVGEIDGDSIFKRPDSIESVDQNLYAYGRYIVDQAKKIDPEINVDTSNEIHHAEHKNHYLTFHSDYQIGGRRY